MEGGEGSLAVGNALIFFMVAVLTRSAEGLTGRTSSALANDQRQEWMALRRGGWRDLDHEVSILISPDE
jgi:hypothetical protein